MTPHWCLAVSVPRKDLEAASGLRRVGVDSHAFCFRDRKLHRGRLVDTSSPAFPRYVFVRVDSDLALRCVEESRDVVDFVKFGDVPAVVPDTVVSSLLAEAEPGDFLLRPVPPRFAFGDAVRVVSGVAFGTEGTYQSSPRIGKAIVLVPWLGQSVPVEFDESCLEKRVPRKSGRSNRRRKYRSAYLM